MRFNRIGGELNSYISPIYKAREKAYYQDYSVSSFISLPSPPNYARQCELSNGSCQRALSDMKIHQTDDGYAGLDQTQYSPETRWVKERVIGRGGFGQVWKVVDAMDSSRELAFKVALQDVDQVKQECQIMHLIGAHPNIVNCYGMTEIDGQSGMLLDYIPGADLSTVMDTLIEQYHSGKITHSRFWGTIQHLIRDVVDVLRHLETQGYCHQDIKPKNIRISSKDLKAFVLDFGSLDKIGEQQRVGSEFYTSPEFYTSGGTSTISDKVDCYSIGQILYSIFSNVTNPRGDDLFTAGAEYGDITLSSRMALMWRLKQSMQKYQASDQATGEWQTALKPVDFHAVDLKLNEPDLFDALLEAKYSTPGNEAMPLDIMIEAVDADLKELRTRFLSGFHGAGGATSVVDFINRNLHPSSDGRLNASSALKHDFLTDIMCDDASIKKVLKAALVKIETEKGNEE
ncbi:protein kinase domain-containing protein [Endozoicomonas sp.]|uniref:protein kinase domain-containing protein n=1 Tax=Endozoicomonas sp. TaxID=1892382 RepID=UPI003AF7AFD8